MISRIIGMQYKGTIFFKNKQYMNSQTHQNSMGNDIYETDVKYNHQTDKKYMNGKVKIYVSVQSHKSYM